MMKAGMLRHIIEIHKMKTVQNTETGEREQKFEKTGQVWASIAPVSVKDFVANQSELQQVNTRITVRFTTKIDERCRIYHIAKQQWYEIKGLLADAHSGKEYLTLACCSVVYP